MTRRKTVTILTAAVLFILLMLGMYVLPLERQTGLIDVTRMSCVSTPTAVKRYHLLFGQKYDFEAVRKHLLPLDNAPCGQIGDFRLYL